MAFAAWWVPTHSQQGDMEQGLALLRCGTGADVANDDQAILSSAFFDTSWLPDYSDFSAVASTSNHSERLWNPLGNAWLTHEQLELLSLAYKIGQKKSNKTHAKLL